MGKELSRHNEIFQKIIGELEVSRAFFQAYLPAAIRKDMDFSTLEMVRLNTEGVRDTLDKRDIADALFQVTLKGSPAYILLHTEHQSTVDRLTLLRTIQYSVTGLIDYARLHPKKPLPPVISLIYYHGTQSSDGHPTKVEELLDDKAYAPYLFQPLFIDVGQIPDKELKKHGAMSGIDLLFKHVFDKPTPELMTSLFESLSSNSGDVQYYALQYMVNRFDIEKKKLIDKALKYLQPEKVMTVAEQLKQEGEQIGIGKGIEQGIKLTARNLLNAGSDIAFVAKMTGLTPEQVAALQAENDGQ